MSIGRVLPELTLLFGLLFATASTRLSVIDGMAFGLGLYVVYKIVDKRCLIWIVSPYKHFLLCLFSLLVVLSLLLLPLDSRLYGLTTLYVIGIFFVARFLSGLSYRDQILKGYVLGALLASATGIFIMLFLEQTALYEIVTQTDRLLFFFSDPNVFGAFLIPAVLFMVRDILESQELRKTSASWIFLGILSAALFLTGSRGAYLQGISAVIFYLTLEYKKFILNKKLFVALIILIGFSVSYIGANYNDIFGTRYSASDIPRIENVSFIKNYILEQNVRTLVIGKGNGSYESISPNQFSAHNLYFRLLIENGLLGLFLFLLFLCAVLYGVFRNQKKDSTMYVVLASVVGILIHSMFIDTLHWRHFWLLLGLV